LKTLTIWVGAFVFGLAGGVLGQKLSNPAPAVEGVSAHRAAKFELTDTSGRVVSVWTVDKWGRPFLGMSDAKWEGRVIIGPIFRSDEEESKPPESDAWGIEVTAAGRTASAAIGTFAAVNSKKTKWFRELTSWATNLVSRCYPVDVVTSL